MAYKFFGERIGNKMKEKNVLLIGILIVVAFVGFVVAQEISLEDELLGLESELGNLSLGLVKSQGINVRFEVDDFFRIIFYRPEITPQVTSQVELTNLEKKIINEIKNNLKISRNELSKKLDIGIDTIKEYIRKLKEKGILKRVGETSAGYWEVKEDE